MTVLLISSFLYSEELTEDIVDWINVFRIMHKIRYIVRKDCETHYNFSLYLHMFEPS